MTVKFYNTLGRKTQVFKPIHKGKVGIYSCGPTVYWYQHIGNLRSYIFADTLKKVLQYNKLKVTQIINVTDVGHLTSDSDTGEDKMEKAAAKEGRTAQEIAEHYFSAFKQDLEKLNISMPNKWTKATEHIKEQINLIKKLEKKGFTYKTHDGIYFDTLKFPNYGELAGIKNLQKKEKQVISRVDTEGKRNLTDFALWKFSPKHEKRQQEWQSPWGKGFPGWHIECSAMSTKYLGNHFDIHTGGNDHIPVHHTNEIAQSEAATGKKFVNYWLHGAFLTVKGEKVSKSKGGLYTLTELESLGFKPLVYRYFCLTAHYRSELDFSLESLEASKNSYERLKNICETIKPEKGKPDKKYIKEFEAAINDDLNTPKALQVLWNLIRDEKAKNKYETIKKIDEVLSLDLLKFEKLEIPLEVKLYVEEREAARKAKNWKLADDLRSKIMSFGFTVNDTPEGPIIKKL